MAGKVPASAVPKVLQKLRYSAKTPKIYKTFTLRWFCFSCQSKTCHSLGWLL